MLKQAFQVLPRDTTTGTAKGALRIRAYPCRVFALNGEFTADAQDAVEQAIHVFGAGCVVDDAYPQHCPAVDLCRRYQVVALELNTIANRRVEPVDRVIIEAGRAESKAQDRQLRGRDQFHVLLYAYPLRQVLGALDVMQRVSAQSLQPATLSTMVHAGEKLD